MKIETTNLRKILEALGEARQGDVLQVRIDDPRENDITQTIDCIKHQYPHTFFTFESYLAGGKWWMYIYIRNFKKTKEVA